MIHGHPGDEFQNLYKNTRCTILSRVVGVGGTFDSPPVIFQQSHFSRFSLGSCPVSAENLSLYSTIPGAIIGNGDRN